jgi:hypothetical protein
VGEGLAGHQSSLHRWKGGPAERVWRWLDLDRR